MSNVWADAMQEYASANDALAEATKDLTAARNRESAARNRVNQAQQKLDAILAEMRKQAPRGSDWWDASHRHMQMPRETAQNAL
jgi:chromosome segregation ATPase